MRSLSRLAAISLAAFGLIPLLALIPSFGALTSGMLESVGPLAIVMTIWRESALAASARVLQMGFGTMLVCSTTALLLVLAIAWRAWHNPAARILAWSMALLTWATGLLLVVLPTRTPRVFAGWLADSSLEPSLGVLTMAGMGAAIGMLIRFAVRFPTGLGDAEADRMFAQEEARGERQRQSSSSGWLVFIGFLARLRVQAQRITPLERRRERTRRGIRFAGWAGLPLLGALLGAVAATADLSSIGGGVFSFTFLQFAFGAGVIAPGILLRIQHETGTREARRQVLWITSAFVAVMWLMVLVGVATIVLDLRNHPASAQFFVISTMVLGPPVAGAIVVAGIAGALFYSGSFDPRLVIRSTTLYGMLTVVTAVAFAGVENVMADLLGTWLGLSESLAPWIAGAAAALLVGPAHERLRRLLRSREASDGEHTPTAAASPIDSSPLPSP